LLMPAGEASHRPDSDACGASSGAGRQQCPGENNMTATTA